MSNRILEKPIYQEYYTSSLQRWNQIFNEVDTIWKKTTWSTKIEKKRTEIRRQVKTKLDILLEKTNMHQVNIDQIITKIEKIINSKIEITFRYFDENEIQKPVVLRCLLLEYIETWKKICSEDKEPPLVLYPNELLHLQLSIENQQLIIQIKNKKYKLFIYFQNLSQGKQVTDIKNIIYIVKPSLIELSNWRKYKNLNKKDWIHKYFLQSEGAFDNHVVWYIEYNTINRQLYGNISQLNIILMNYLKQELLYVSHLNKLIIILLFEIWEFIYSLKFLIENNFFLDKQDKTNYSYLKQELDNKMRVFKSDIGKKELTYQKIKYFRNLVIHPGGFNFILKKQQFDLPINYPDIYVMPWFMLTWRSNKDNLGIYSKLNYEYHGDPIIKNGIQISYYTDKKGKRIVSPYNNVENAELNCLFNLSIKTINKVKEFLQDDLSKIN